MGNLSESRFCHDLSYRFLRTRPRWLKCPYGKTRQLGSSLWLKCPSERSWQKRDTDKLPIRNLWMGPNSNLGYLVSPTAFSRGRSHPCKISSKVNAPVYARRCCDLECARDRARSRSSTVGVITGDRRIFGDNEFVNAPCTVSKWRGVGENPNLRPLVQGR